ncbi:MAG: ABC transporter permease subunit [Candidatus Accumulibacter sp.]|uniref:ABC transporter permease subunit n=1 Tax=Accumulibacter sp. TaxID=2053492 RepID=UPI001A3E6A7D|nr:ABC transporter permease subunit [Accumulibacter sp.]MBL8366544.1 ABC transporter permease subunit [Accumulibacter sp.]
MASTEIVDLLWTWTPFLAGGFAWNILISLVAMLIGTLFGAVLARLRLSGPGPLAHASLLLTELTRNIPTFVFLFYLAFLIPAEFAMAGDLYAFPVWLKASLALSVAVIGFVSDNLFVALQHRQNRNHAATLLFIPSWTTYLLIIVMASSTASVIGVGEIVSRCNVVIAAVGGDETMLWVYTYAIAYFLLFCLPLNWAMGYARKRLLARIEAAAS